MSDIIKLEKYKGIPDKDRLVSALRREPVDRVPNFENLVEDKHVEKILGKWAGNTMAYGGNPGKGPGDLAKRPMLPDDYIDFCNMVGQDVLLFDGGLWTPFKKKHSNGEILRVIDKSIKTSKDFEELILDTQWQIDFTLKYIKEYKDAVKSRGSRIGVGCLFGCLSQTLYEFVIGMNDFMMLVYEDREFIEFALEKSTLHFVNLCDAIVGAGVDFIWVADDIAFKTGLFIPPKIIKEIWVTRIARIIEPAVNAGIPVTFHSDGKVDDIVEDLIEIGVDCLNPMDPYGVDYREYKKRYGDRLCLSGNVDIEFPLSKGTPEDIENDVKEHMKILKQGYGYIASSSHSIVDYIPHENYIAFLNAIHKYGRY